MNNKTTIQLLRGADTIGGSCIRIAHGDDCILLDYGMPLMASGGDALNEEAVRKPSLENGILLDVLGQGSNPLAFIISHAHLDHYGLIDHAPEDIPIYLGDSSKKMIEVGNIFYPPAMRVQRIDRCHSFAPGKPFQIGPFTITAHLVDHSAFGACSLLVEVAGKRILYTGDIRGHGRKTEQLDRLIRAVPEPDALLMEGTTLNDGHPNTFPTETAVEDAVLAACRNSTEPVFVAGSGSNIDRLVSLYRAAKRSQRLLVVDVYQAYLLSELKEFAPGLPPHDDDCLRIYFPYQQYQTLKEAEGYNALGPLFERRIKPRDIDWHNGRYLFRLSNWYTKRLCESALQQGIQPQLVYSMWQGYLKEQPAFAAIEELTGRPWQYIHTSGHAYADALKQLASGLKPKRLIPVHTLRGDEFAQHFDNVVRLDNGEILELL